jgi:hypothetical protein
LHDNRWSDESHVDGGLANEMAGLAMEESCVFTKQVKLKAVDYIGDLNRVGAANSCR